MQAESKENKKLKNKKYASLIIAGFCAFLGALGQLFFKLGSGGISSGIFLLLNWQIILGVLLYAIATILLILMLKKAELSLLYPVIATSYIWVAFFSLFLVRETLHIQNWIGILLIVGGVYFTSYRK